MESFPKPENNNIKKAALVGVALVGLTATAEAQMENTHTEPRAIVRTVENSEFQKENQQILSNLTALEKQVKDLSGKTAKEDALVFSFLSESDALKQASFTPRKWELSALFDAELTAVNNNTDADYKVITRDMSAIHGLLNERHLDNTHGGVKHSKVLSVYNPIDYYIIIGVDKEQGSNEAISRVRFVNMKTKEVEVREVKTPITAVDEIEQSNQIEKSISKEVKDFIDSKNNKD